MITLTHKTRFQHIAFYRPLDQADMGIGLFGEPDRCRAVINGVWPVAIVTMSKARTLTPKVGGDNGCSLLQDPTSVSWKKQIVPQIAPK